MNILSRREMIQRIHDHGFTEAAEAMRRRYIPCDVGAWHTYFLSGGNVFLDADLRNYFMAPAQLRNRPDISF